MRGEAGTLPGGQCWSIYSLVLSPSVSSLLLARSAEPDLLPGAPHLTGGGGGSDGGGRALPRPGGEKGGTREGSPEGAAFRLGLFFFLNIFIGV